MTSPAERVTREEAQKMRRAIYIAVDKVVADDVARLARSYLEALDELEIEHKARTSALEHLEAHEKELKAENAKLREALEEAEACIGHLKEDILRHLNFPSVYSKHREEKFRALKTNLKPPGRE